MFEPAQGLGLLPEFFDDVLVLEHLGREHLDDDVAPVNLQVARQVDGAHAADAQLVLDEVAALDETADQTLLAQTHASLS